MQFTVATLAAFIGLAMSVALPETAAAGVKESSLVQRLEHGGAQIFGRSIPCASNDPGQCCACRGGYGTCVNNVCYCQGGDC
ncbi:hypothetical protein PG999_009716 [Apiospora kogelbergensis]|uniref:Uncharacterized protein n=1 Tax=Apiospora kogelbergensis TaxID=1337665 RepID=A0AAW0QLE1_9PEZI